ncbi:MAG: ATP-binding protein [Syntrophaceae bacterium CG2_30_49_12]|nr:MAG: ATP-binding protein [Syntrophaceae bacterium CG2_30_49_12]PIP06952.1 MAG: ATP-binding protein [Syntrophobacterales bacterium CG23_combo_of_CG06-09_8_20_14_all_48_27]
MEKIEEVSINNSEDIILARQIAREMAKELGFGLADQTRITTAVSELSRNIYTFAGTGRVVVKALSESAKKGMEIIAEDRGPGIPDIEMAMQDGYSTNKGLGQGLPGTKRLMDEFEIKSEAGKGATVTIRKWLR